jgi:hypothetical protein
MAAAPHAFCSVKTASPADLVCRRRLRIVDRIPGRMTSKQRLAARLTPSGMGSRLESVTEWQEETVTLHTGRMRRRCFGIGAVAVVGLLVAALVAHLYVTAYGTGDPQSERAAALKAARQIQAKTDGRLWVAAYRPNAGAHEQSNTGRACFGRTVEVRMVWKDASFGNGGSSDASDTPKALILTADATSGTVCFVSAEYGAAAADLPAGSIYLYGPRRALVPRS